jgi:hypothetical protein
MRVDLEEYRQVCDLIVFATEEEALETAHQLVEDCAQLAAHGLLRIAHRFPLEDLPPCLRELQRSFEDLLLVCAQVVDERGLVDPPRPSTWRRDGPGDGWSAVIDPRVLQVQVRHRTALREFERISQLTDH